MDRLQVALALLKLVNFVIGAFQRQMHINEGIQRQIARELAAIAKATKAASKLREEVDAMTEAEVDEVLMQ